MADHIPVMRGDFFVSVSAYDAALRPYHRNPYRIAYSIDKQQAYEIIFNQFSYTDPENFGLVYDLGKPGPAYYESPILLGNPVGIPLPFGGNGSRISVRSLAPGLHHLQMDATDSTGNASSAFLDFVVNQPPAVTVESLASEGTNLAVGLRIDDPDWKRSRPSSFAGEVEFSIDDGKTFLPFPMVSLNLQGPPDAARLICRAPVASFNARRILLKIRGYDGVEYSPYKVLALTSLSPPVVEELRGTPKGEVTVRKYADALKVEFNTNELITYPLQLSDGTTTYAMNSWNLTSYSAFVPAPPAKDTLTLTLPGPQQTTIPLHFLRSNEGGSVRGENFEFSVDAGGLYDDAFLWPDALPAYKTPLSLPGWAAVATRAPRPCVEERRKTVVPVSFGNTPPGASQCLPVEPKPPKVGQPTFDH